MVVYVQEGVGLHRHNPNPNPNPNPNVQEGVGLHRLPSGGGDGSGAVVDEDEPRRDEVGGGVGHHGARGKVEGIVHGGDVPEIITGG